MSDYPVRPILTDALVAKIHFANEDEGQRERAYDTMFRHSDAGSCARKMAYAYFALSNDHYAPSEPVDLAGEWVMYLGTLIHEKVQDALHDRFGSACEVEVKVRHGNLSSGHVDAVIRHPELGTVDYELKTKGSYGFDKAIGINRKAYQATTPEGPGTGAKIQGALNATANNADLLILGVIGLEAISKPLAARVGWNDLERIMAEWHYEPAEFGPWAKAELERMEVIRATIDEGLLPPRVAIGDSMQLLELNPDASRPDWRCSYCQFNSICRRDG